MGHIYCIMSLFHYVPLEGVFLKNDDQTMGHFHSHRHITVLRFSQCLCEPLFDTSPEPLCLSVGAWRMSTQSSRCYRGICSTDNLLHAAGFLSKLMAFLWQFYILVEMWPQGLTPWIIVTLIRKWVPCCVGFEVNSGREAVRRPLWIKAVTELVIR